MRFVTSCLIALLLTSGCSNIGGCPVCREHELLEEQMREAITVYRSEYYRQVTVTDSLREEIRDCVDCHGRCRRKPGTPKPEGRR